MSAETRHSSSSAFARARGPGMVVGDFYIDSEVGKGSFAQVYMGVHKDRKEVVAIKSVDLAKLSQNKKLKENLNGEIKILKTLRHPHIVALHDCVESPTHIHLVMEYCELGDLSLFIKKREKLSTHPATHDMARKYPSAPNAGLHEVIIRHFLKQLVSALHFLRSKNCIHRDVKPQNLLLLPSPQYRHANSRPIMTASHDSLMPVVGLPSLPMLKLADFGFARVLPSTSLADTLCGSPLYMAPEILRYERYDAKADLWSVGTVLFEMVTGRPPTRARNHVELLRKIEAAQDVIVFPREVAVSSEMKALIRALLKRHPLERMGFDHFFSHPVVTGPIPGLVEDDVPIARPLERTSSRRSLNELPPPPPQQQQYQQYQQYQQHDSSSYPSRRNSRQPDERLSDLAINVPRSPRERTSSSPRVLSPVERYGRPPIEGTARHTYAAGQDGSGEGLGIRPKPHSATTAPIRPPRLSDTGARTAHARRRMTEEELAAQDVADMREYVVIEKKQVEINAFADEIDAKGRAPPTVATAGAAASAASAAAAATSASASTSTTAAAAAADASSSPRSQALVSRTQGHDVSVSPTSTTSAISRAIHDASLRLFGYYPHAAGRVPRGQSPPPFYSPYPVYSTPQLSSTAAGLIMGDGKHGAGSDDDTRAVKVFEELASRSDVVYGFAEVKFRQLFPTAPSAERSLGTPEDGACGGDANPAEDDEDEDEEDDLTAEAIVCLSEEAFVLYYKALTLLAKTMDLANGWWSRKTAFPGHPMTQRVNSVVQWVRTRFNEVLEKTEMVKLKLVEGQKRLPDTHPHHPSNNGAGADSIASTPTLLGAAVMTTGISAEKLMYDRAVDMSRVAAIREISHSDLRGCEISYITAIRMLEVVLDSDDESLRKKAPGVLRESREEGSVGGGGGVGEDMATTHLDSEDRRAVRKLIQMISTRLSTVEKKMQDIAEAEKSQQALQLRRRSGDVTPRSFPPHPSPS